MKKVCWGAIVLVVVLFAVWLVKHSGFFPYSHNPMQYMPNMHRTPVLIPQRGYSFFEDGSSVRVPPQGTIAATVSTYPYTKETLAADITKRANPLAATREVLARGKKQFMTYCVVCHGDAGYGNGLVVPPFPQPPSLQSDKIRGFADSQLFHIITVGQNSMGAYGPVIREDDRWAIIHYIRAMQRAENPSDEDLKAFDQVVKPSGGAR